jgi:hypothetical protein
MFCPRCGTENDLAQRFCRKCGQSLSSVRLVLEGRVDEATAALETEQKPAQYRVRIAASAFLILTALAAIFSGHRFGLKNLDSAAILLILALLVFMRLAAKTRRVARLLDPDEQLTNLPLYQSGNSDAVLPEARTVARSNPTVPAPLSVTEQTTLELDQEQPVRRRPLE